jgi:AcrR family transcriptional regulator
VRDIAAEAGVSVETVYAAVGTKAQVLKQALDVAIVGDDEPVDLTARPEFQAMSAGDLRARTAAASVCPGRGPGAPGRLAGEICVRTRDLSAADGR